MGALGVNMQLGTNAQRYRVILADPPWDFKQSAKKIRSQYPLMSHEELAALPVSEWTDKNAVLFMWTIQSHLEESLQLMAAWGFRYKTVAFTWVKTEKSGKPVFGLGNFTRSCTELCLLGVRGRGLERQSRSVRQLITAARREHSRKPDEQYDRIMLLYDGPYLELFARQQWPGWDAWGNEVGKFQSPNAVEHELAGVLG